MQTRRRPRSDAALRWWASLNEQPTPESPSRPLGVALALAAALAVAATPLVWHHLLVPNPAFFGPDILEVLTGWTTASWLVPVAAVAAALAVRTFLRSPSLGLAVMVIVLAFVTVNGMFIDYLDWSRRGVSLLVGPFFGPGYYLGLACAAVLVVAAVIGWRSRT
jgi:hypothetical protein